MPLLDSAPYLVTGTVDINLTASNVSSGYVIITPDFSGHIITIPSGFAAALYTQLLSPALNFAFTVQFSCGSGNSAKLINQDSDLITTHSNTFMTNGGSIRSSREPLLLFVVSQLLPPQFNVYG